MLRFSFSWKSIRNWCLCLVWMYLCICSFSANFDNTKSCWFHADFSLSSQLFVRELRTCCVEVFFFQPWTRKINWLNCLEKRKFWVDVNKKHKLFAISMFRWNKCCWKHTHSHNNTNNNKNTLAENTIEKQDRNSITCSGLGRTKPEWQSQCRWKFSKIDAFSFDLKKKRYFKFSQAIDWNCVYYSV